MSFKNKKMRNLTFTILTVIMILAVTAFSVIEATNRSIDPDYSVKFSTSLAGGTFSGLKGTVVFSPADPSNAKIDVSVDATTINTGNSLKDTHAKGEEWLNVEKFPLVKFSSTAITKENDHYLIDGKMEIHGVSKSVKVPVKYEEKNGKGIFTGEFTINREDYGVTGSGIKAKMVGDNVKVSFNIPTSTK